MNRFFRLALMAVVCSFVSVTARAQFKVVKAAPFPPTVARQKIRALLEGATAENRDQTVATISEWLDWYRDILDEELIARWKSNDRANLTFVMAPLADARVANEIVEFSWHTDRPDTFLPQYAPMLGDLMERYPTSAKPLLADLLPPPALNLTAPEAQTVGRIFLDMPDIGTWRNSALMILPRYRAAVDGLLKQDLGSTDQERVYRAMRWRTDLGLEPPAVSNQKPAKSTVRAAAGKASLVTPAGPSASASSASGPSDGFAQRPHIVGTQGDVAPQASAVSGYTGPMSGTFESKGDPIPQNGECVFPNIPPVKLLLDFDTKHWEARLEPGDGNTQSLVMRNKGKGSQKKCVVRWSVVD
jgi:hypothetical protein